MNINQYNEIAHLEGLKFIQALLSSEEQRFAHSQFFKGATFEDINADFGIFPTTAAYPVYFAGDVRDPKDKIIFMGINPGFNEEGNRNEQAFLQTRGSFEGYCRLLGDFRFQRKAGLLPYYANIAGFLRRYNGMCRYRRTPHRERRQAASPWPGVRRQRAWRQRRRVRSVCS